MILSFAAADTFDIARSKHPKHLVEQLAGATKRRGQYQRQYDDEPLAAIRQFTDARPTYHYLRISPLLNRARRATGAEPVDHKRVFRLMVQGTPVAQAPRRSQHDPRARRRVIVPAFNQRWSCDLHRMQGEGAWARQRRVALAS